MFDTFLCPLALCGAVAGLALAAIFHWLAPVGVGTVEAGAWLVGLGAIAGLGWDLLTHNKR